jgi:hypothetical protein
MAFKGVVSNGSTVEAEFSSDTSNTGSASLLIGLGALGGGAQGGHAIVAPGGSAHVNVDASEPGILRVFVDVAGHGDTGMLEVTVDGSRHDRETILGDTTWTYSVE